MIDCFIDDDSVVITGKAISLDQHKDVGMLYPVDND